MCLFQRQCPEYWPPTDRSYPFSRGAELSNKFVGPRTHWVATGGDYGVVGKDCERDVVWEALAAASITVQREASCDGEDARKLALAFGECGYFEDRKGPGHLARSLAESLASGGWESGCVASALRVVSSLFRIGLSWEEARGRLGAGVARAVAESVIFSTSRLGKGLSKDEACVALWYMGILGGSSQGQVAAAVTPMLFHASGKPAKAYLLRPPCPGGSKKSWTKLR